MTKKLAGKVALITGGSRGIGAAIARRLALDGAAVAITYASAQQKADEVVRAIGSAGGRAVAIRADRAGPRWRVTAGARRSPTWSPTSPDRKRALSPAPA